MPSPPAAGPTKAALCLLSDSGTGKSHLLIALVEAADDKQLTKAIAR